MWTAAPPCGARDVRPPVPADARASSRNVMISSRSSKNAGCSMTAWRSRGRGNGTVRTSPSRASGPLVIIATRSERNSASSTSCVTISAVLLVRAPQVEQHFLQLEARQRVEHAERLVEQQHLAATARRRARCRRAGACPARARPACLCSASPRPTSVEVVRRRSRRAPARGCCRVRPGRRRAARSRARSSTAAGTAPGTPRRDRGPGRRSPCRRG